MLKGALELQSPGEAGYPSSQEHNQTRKDTDNIRPDSPISARSARQGELSFMLSRTHQQHRQTVVSYNFCSYKAMELTFFFNSILKIPAGRKASDMLKGVELHNH